MKNLTAEIKTGHKNRTVRISEIKRETRDILGKTDDYMKGVAVELKEMARDLKNFLAKSEDTRKKDFNVMINAIRAKVKDIKGNTADLLVQYDKEMKELAADLKDFLKKSETTRMADFNGMMKDIATDIDSIRKSVSTLLADYKAERKEAARYWLAFEGKKIEKEEDVKEEEKFKCKVCGKEFGKKIALMGHMRSHKKKKK